ncbi:two-component system NtrC family response regulator/two-component system response regulator AtoC [Melghirimyces profundicolus]|uniref:Two-component system NtrC family response regulator/two-component system response regulator AtoC n=1 Tax=Melghirimyces profundicolus TaxID=1242148 RepID=A0A2T6C7W5_9BACL|nr:sigma-54 dependent transcriptional regulator [Melghirimyces profundicolus]PTX64395.1 two-component system NtrC family response regulator/two-component system response regulator AtoC [Melghirimyces profundicolus]
MNTLLFVDDEIQLLRILASSFRKKGYEVHTAFNGGEARKKLIKTKADIIFLDLKLPDTTGIDLLQEFVPLYPEKLFVIMTAYSDVESAVTAMKAGAFDYIVKPAKLDEMQVVIDKATEWLKMKRENVYLKETLQQIQSEGNVIGVSSSMKRIFEMVERAANTNATILLEGESGTGKSLIARMVHQLSEREKKPFISVNCAAIPEQLLESELFGYEKGSFTGAHSSRKGKFAAAHEGTIFLDEIGEIPPSLQGKLLQVIQEKSFMRLGSNTLEKVDVRIIAATNRDLKKRVEEGAFREDLYYRLNIVDIYVPPLRERKEDIPILIETFLEKNRTKYNKSFHLSSELRNILIDYDWPGNVRELENAVERAAVLCSGNQLSIDDFPPEIKHIKQKENQEIPDQWHPSLSLPEHLEQLEKQLILSALEQSSGQITGAARILSISKQRLLYKMNKYSIR